MNCLTSLYSHQQRAVDKLARSRVGALIMEMGTGKTRTAIEFIRLREQRTSRAIWYCPVALKDTIAYEIAKHTDLRPDQVHVFDEHTSPRNLPPARIYIIGIESMSSSNRVILAANKLIDENSFVIVDESSYIKGHNALRTRRITRLAERAKYRMILTGTPLSQGVVDLYAQMKFLSPQILGYKSFYSFAHNHLEYSEKYPGMILRALNTDLLAAKIHPYSYQVTKEECLDLPKKLTDELFFYLTEEQREAYQQAKDEILAELDYDRFDSITIFRLFTALQQIVSGFWNKDGKLLEFPHRRLDMVDAAIDYQIPTGDKVIIWTKYVYSLQRIVERLRERFGADAVSLLYGDQSGETRKREVDRWRSEAQFLVSTQSTGGHGFTFNEACHVIFYENGFKYSERLQAEDRCHRIGQTMPVTYIDIRSSGGIDYRIRDALARKGNVVNEFRQKVERIKDKKRAEVRKMIKDL
jgi:SNF2 family DNA or RNA helicase